MFKDYTSEQAQEGHQPPLVTVHPSADPTQRPHAIGAQAVEFFETLPDELTFDELLDAVQEKGHSAERIVEYLRAYERLDMASVEDRVIRKTGRMPYF